MNHVSNTTPLPTLLLWTFLQMYPLRKHLPATVVVETAVDVEIVVVAVDSSKTAVVETVAVIKVTLDPCARSTSK